jgi:hypothetical protein
MEEGLMTMAADNNSKHRNGIREQMFLQKYSSFRRFLVRRSPLEQ